MGKKTILCIPGLGSTKEFFSPLSQTDLSHVCNIMAIDLPGFGDRWVDLVPDNPIAAAAEIVAQEVEKIGCRESILVGQSIGGAVALLAARKFGGQIWGIALVEGNLVAEDCGISRRLATAESLADCGTIKADAIAQATISEKSGVRDWARALKKVSPDTLSKYCKELVKLSDSEDLLRQFHADQCRKIYLYGDEYVGHPVLRRLDSIPVEYIRGSGHISFIGDAPQTCASALLKIL